jgi:hypothetical protein
MTINRGTETYRKAIKINCIYIIYVYIYTHTYICIYAQHDKILKTQCMKKYVCRMKVKPEFWTPGPVAYPYMPNKDSW